MEANSSSEDIKNLTSIISSAFRQRAKGQTQKYQFILQQLRCGTDEVLFRLYSALRRCTGDIAKDSYLGEEFAPAALGVRFRPLPHADVAAVTAAQEAIGVSAGAPASAAILSIRTAEALLSFAVDLVASSPSLLPTVVRALVKGLAVAQAEADAYAGLRIQRDAADAMQKGLPAPSSLHPDVAETLSSLLTSYTRSVYSTLARLVQIVPTGTAVIAAALQDAAPLPRASLAAHVAYVRHVLTLASRRYLPAIRDRLVAGLVDKMVEVDSSIQLDLLPEGTDEAADENDVPVLIAASPSTSSGEGAGMSEDVASTVASAAKLDHLCLYMFRFVHGYMCSCKGKTPAQVTARKGSIMSDVSESGGESQGRGASDQRPADQRQTGESEYDTQYDTDHPGAGEANAALPAYSPTYGVRANIDGVLDSDHGCDCSTVHGILHMMLGPARQSAAGRPPKASGSASDHASELDTDTKSHSSAPGIPLPPAARSSAGRADREHVFALMLGVFERSVLLTHRSKFVQFLLFYACAMGSDFVDRFVGRLIAQVRADDRPALTRMTCASYLGSFLGRATFVSDATLRSALFYTLEWAHGYIDLHAAHALYHDKASGYVAGAVGSGLLEDGSKGGGGVSASEAEETGAETDAGKSSFTDKSTGGGPRARLETLKLPPSSLELDPSLPPLPPVDVFHAVVQAACYTLVFRAEFLRQLVGGLDFLRSFAWGRLVACPLDPLAHTAEHVAKEFIRAAYALKLATSAELQSCSAYEKLRLLQEAEEEEEEDSSEDDSSASDSSDDVDKGAADQLGQQQGDQADEAESSQSESEAAVPALLETFFPFDPFLLRKSSRYISGMYRGWSTSRLPIVLAESDGYDTGLTAGGGAARGNGYVSAGAASRQASRDRKALAASSGPDSDIGGHVSASSGTRMRHGGAARMGGEGTEEDMDEEEEDDGDNEAALAEPSSSLASPALGAASGGVAGHEGGTAGAGGIMSRMRAGFQLGPPASLAPGLAAAVAGADDTQALLAGLDIDVDVDEEEEDEEEDDGGEADKPKHDRRTAADARRSPSEGSATNDRQQQPKKARSGSVASYSAPGLGAVVLGGKHGGAGAARRRLDSHASSRSGRGAGGLNSAGSSPALGPVTGSNMTRIRGMSLSGNTGGSSAMGGAGEAVLKRAKQSLTSKSAMGRHTTHARSAIDGAHLLQQGVDVSESPSVNALKSRMRGLSVDESAYYASLAGVTTQQQQGDGTSLAAHMQAEIMDALLEEEDQQVEREEEEGSPSSEVGRSPNQSSTSSPLVLMSGNAQGEAARAAVPAISLAVSTAAQTAAAAPAPLSLKRRRTSTSSSEEAEEGVQQSPLTGHSGPQSVVVGRQVTGATHRPRLSIGLSPFDPQSSLPPDLHAAAQAHQAASVEESPTVAAESAEGPRRSGRSVRKAAKLNGDDTAAMASTRSSAVSGRGGRGRGKAATLQRAASDGAVDLILAAEKASGLATSASAPMLMSGAYEDEASSSGLPSSGPSSARAASQVQGQGQAPAQAVPTWDLFQSMMLAAADELTPNRAAARDAQNAADAADSEVNGGFAPTRTASHTSAPASTGKGRGGAGNGRAAAGRKTR